MIEKSVDEIVTTAEALKRGKWHFHMLSTKCIFNERKDKEAFILEDGEKHRSYAHYSEERQMQAGKKLVKMLHGEKILREPVQEKMADNHDGQDIIEKARMLKEKNLPWHHHLLFPSCIFNEDDGSWKLVLEDEAEKDLLEASYPSEPVSDLRKIELLFYK